MRNIKQKIHANAESICKTCIHSNVCWAIDNQPCVECSQYEPVKIGRWILGTGENALQKGYRMCSQCGEIVKYAYTFYGKHNYCPNCGAYMALPEPPKEDDEE